MFYNLFLFWIHWIFFENIFIYISLWKYLEAMMQYHNHNIIYSELFTLFEFVSENYSLLSVTILAKCPIWMLFSDIIILFSVGLS